MVTVHVSRSTKSAAGSSVKIVGPPEAVAVTVPETEHETVNHVPATFTGSLNATSMFASMAASTAPFAGVIDETTGAASPAIGSPPAWMSSIPTHSSLPDRSS